MKKSANIKEHIKLTISLSKLLVPIYLGTDIFSEIASLVSLKDYTRIAVLMDKNVAKHWGEKIRKVLGKNITFIIIPAGESRKELSTVENILFTMLENGFDRKSLLINMGGGVICDIGGFAASTYMRGISFINVPTTLLAQTDAAIGGKTGVDFGRLKNMIGSFAHPSAVLCDTTFLTTLPKREFKSGFAEIIKHALVYNKKFLQTLSKENFSTLHGDKLAAIISISCKIKCAIVAKDVGEKGLRRILNFGHTIGHAIEMVSQTSAKPLLHGEAISIGMVAEARLSLLAGFITKQDFQIVEETITKAGLPTRIDRSYKKGIRRKILDDKKNINRKIKWVLLKGIGNASIDEDQPDNLINKAIDYVLV